MANSNGWGDGAANNAIGWGQGANNAIGWGDIHADSWAGLTDIVGITTDPDAQAFITAAAITDSTQQSAINQLVVDLKGYGIWSKMKALYPFVGGTATQHKWNLKDPRDLDVAFRLVFSGGWTHSSTGATPNGTNATADTKLNASSNLSQNSTHISFYSRTLSGSNLVPTMASSGYAVTGGTRLSLNFASQTYFGVNTLYQDGVSNTNTRGFFIANRTASATHSLMIRGTRTDISQASDGIVNQTFRIGGSPAGHYDNKEAAFASIGDGLTNTDMTNLTTAVQTFQTTLGRSIGTQTVSDADAQAFVTNAGIVDQVEANAINNLVIGLKADSLWTKMKAVYPMVGGTSTTTSYNLVNTAQYQISWSGGVTWGANGVQFGGVNGYGNTGLNQSSVLSQNSQHISFYSRTNTDANLVDIGLKSSGSAYTMLQTKYSNTFTASLNEFYNFADHSANTNSQGFYVGNRTGATVRNNWKNGSKVHTSSSASQTQANFNFFVGAYNNAGTAANYTNRECAFASIGDGLTDTEATNLNTRVTTFQTALNRNV